MSTDDHLPLLRRVPLFQGLKPLQLTEIARRAERITFDPDEVIIAAGEKGKAALLVVSGEAVCKTRAGLFDAGDAVPVGSLLAEMAMLVETEHSATVVARTTVHALKIRRAEIHAQMSDDPALADHFVAVISSRLLNFGTGAAPPRTEETADANPSVPSAAAIEPAEDTRSSVFH